MGLYGLYVVPFLCLLILCTVEASKYNENKTISNTTQTEPPTRTKRGDPGAVALLFAEELKQTLEKYLFGLCPHTYKIVGANKPRNATGPTCDLDVEHLDLPGRLSALSLRADRAGRAGHGLGAALGAALADLAREAAELQHASGASPDAAKKRKLSKSQKNKIQAKQRTALAVKKKAAALAAAAAAKLTPTT